MPAASPIRVAFVRQRYTAYGGAERFLANAMQTLERRGGVRMTLIARRWEGATGLSLLSCDPFYLGRLWRDWSFSLCVRRRLASRPFDLVQCHERVQGCDLYRAGDGVHREWLRQRRRALGLPGRLALALSPYHRYLLAAERRALSSPQLKAVVCNSRMVSDEIRAHFGLPGEKLRVIYNAVDLQAFHPSLRSQRTEMRRRYEIPENATLFLFVGSGFERKGLPTLLAAMAELPQQAYLLVVGKDTQAKRFTRLAARMGLSEHVRFAGPQREVGPFYGAADALVMPTLYDPFPNAVLEAMAAGLPAITSLKSGAAERITAGVNGYVCDALDRAGLVSSMRELLDPGRAAEIGAQARASLADLAPDIIASQWLALYRELLETRESL